MTWLIQQHLVLLIVCAALGFILTWLLMFRRVRVERVVQVPVARPHSAPADPPKTTSLSSTPEELSAIAPASAATVTVTAAVSATTPQPQPDDPAASPVGTLPNLPRRSPRCMPVTDLRPFDTQSNDVVLPQDRDPENRSQHQ